MLRPGTGEPVCIARTYILKEIKAFTEKYRKGPKEDIINFE